MAEHEEVRLGMRVRDVHGEVMGTVVRLGTGRFLVQRGNVVKESVIVPDRCVAAVNAGEIVLTCGHRELIDAMHNPPIEEERNRAEQYRYAEIQAEREEREAKRKAAAPASERTGVESLSEHPGKVRVVREEIAVNPGSAHEYQVRGTDEEEREAERENDPDTPVH